jgi:hypothetical protein
MGPDTVSLVVPGFTHYIARKAGGIGRAGAALRRKTAAAVAIALCGGSIIVAQIDNKRSASRDYPAMA